MPPIGQIDLTEAPEHHVLGFDVTVHDASLVGEGHRIGDRAEDLEMCEATIVSELDVLPMGMIGTLDEVEPAHPLHALHDEDGLASLRAPEKMHRNDIGMLESTDDSRLANERVAIE